MDLGRDLGLTIIWINDMIFNIFFITYIKILIFSLCALRMAVTDQVRVDTLARTGAVEVGLVCAGEAV